MNKFAIIGIAILVTIGIMFAIAQVDEDDSPQQTTVIEEISETGGKNYVVGLHESVGMSEGP